MNKTEVMEAERVEKMETVRVGSETMKKLLETVRSGLNVFIADMVDRRLTYA